MRRVVVTGLGIVSPIGIGKEAFWSACREGASGVGPIQSFDASCHPVKIAAEVKEFDVTPFLPISQRKSIKVMSRAMQFAVGAASLAVTDSGLDLQKENPESLGVVMGTGIVPVDLRELAAAIKEACDDDGNLQVNKLGKCGGAALFPLWILLATPQHGCSPHFLGA